MYKNIEVQAWAGDFYTISKEMLEKLLKESSQWRDE